MATPRYHEPGNSKAVIAYLDENDSTRLTDGSAIIPSTTRGRHLMVHFPNCYYRNEDLGNNRYKLYVSDIKVNNYYKQEEERLLGAFEGTVQTELDTNILCSYPYYASTDSYNIVEFYQYAQNIGSNWGLIDYRAHKTIANMFCIMYGNTNISTLNPDIPCSGGTKNYSIGSTGGTMVLGNKDGRAVANGTQNYYSTSFLGLEDCYGSKSEFVQGINILSRQWIVYDGGLSVDKTADQLIAEGFTNVRVIGTAPVENNTIKRIQHGEYADIMPIECGPGTTDHYYSNTYFYRDGKRILIRSGARGNGGDFGIFHTNAGDASYTTDVSIGSRLAFYGPIEVVTPEEWLKLSPQYGDNSGSGGIN